MRLSGSKNYFQQGFTLLELLMVVTILSSTAMVAMMTFDGSTSHHRIVDTENRLKLLKQATVKTTVDYEGITHISGYVVDNGKLPNCIAGLMSADACDDSLTDAAIMNPIYDSGIYISGDFNRDPSVPVNAADQISLDENNEKLYKGFRPVYLGSIVSDEFRDGWGNQSTSDDDKHWGWSSASDATGSLFIESLGRDNLDDSNALISYNLPYQDQDQNISISESEWSMPVGSVIDVTLTNNSGNRIFLKDTNVVADDYYSLVLLEYENGHDDQGWRHHYSASDALTSNALDSTSSLFLDIDAEKSIKLTLADRLAVGEHILMVVGYTTSGGRFTKESACIDNGEGGGTADDWNCDSGEEIRLTKKVFVYPVSGLKKVNWEIK